MDGATAYGAVETPHAAETQPAARSQRYTLRATCVFGAVRLHRVARRVLGGRLTDERVRRSVGMSAIFRVALATAAVSIAVLCVVITHRVRTPSAPAHASAPRS